MAPINREDLEWYRSPEAESRGITPDEIRKMEDLLARKERLVAKIQSAFAGVRLGDGIGLLEAEAWDMCVDAAKPAEARTRDERESWKSISEKNLEFSSATALCFTDAEGYRFLLPAFMLAELNLDFDVWTVIHLSLVRDDKREKHTLLNRSQLQTIIEFLELYLDDRGSELQHQDITEALKVYWRPLLEKTAEQPAPSDVDKPSN